MNPPNAENFSLFCFLFGVWMPHAWKSSATPRLLFSSDIWWQKSATRNFTVYLSLYGPYILESVVHDGFAFIDTGGFPYVKYGNTWHVKGYFLHHSICISKIFQVKKKTHRDPLLWLSWRRKSFLRFPVEYRKTMNNVKALSIVSMCNSSSYRIYNIIQKQRKVKKSNLYQRIL